jgi:mycothiol synthase
VSLPPGYLLRRFRPGDELALARLFADGGLGLETTQAVQKEFVGDRAFRPERVFILECAGEAVGTASMWTSADDPKHAYLHMLTVLSAHRSKHLGWALATVAALQAHREGFTSQRLFTDDWRHAAIRLYLDIGYCPLYADDTHPQRWAEVAERLQRPELLRAAKRGRTRRRPNLLSRVRRRVALALAQASL